MPDKSEFKETFEYVEECVNRVGDETIEERSTEKLEDSEFWSIPARRGGYNYLVSSSPMHEYFNIEFPFNLIENLETNPGISDAKALLEKQDEDMMNELIVQLTREISHPSVSAGVQTTEGGGLAGFRVNKAIFPYREAFDISDFDEAVTAVVSQGDMGVKYIQLALNIEDLKSDGPDLDPDKGIH